MEPRVRYRAEGMLKQRRDTPCPLSAANEYRIFLADVNIVIYARDKLLSSRDVTLFIVLRHCALPCTLPMFLEIYLSVRLMGLVGEREQGSGPRRNHALRLGNSSGDECHAARFRSLPIQSVLSFTKRTPIIAGLVPGRLRALRCAVARYYRVNAFLPRYRYR